MTFPMLVALAAGMVIEVLLLWERSAHDAARSQSGFVPGPPSPIQALIGLVVLVAALLVALVDGFGLQVPAFWIDAFSNGIMFVAFSFLFVFGLVVPRLMPRVNEQAILAVNLVTLLNLAVMPGLPPVVLAGFAVPGMLLLLLGVTRQSLSPMLKSLVYFWYLVCLLALTLQNDFSVFISNELQPANLFQMAVAGAAGIFLLLHALFLVRFFLMLSALILPHNRKYLFQVMPGLFGDEQMPALKFLSVLGVAAGAYWAAVAFGLASLPAANLLILFIVHFMDRLPFVLHKKV